ncbi:hypothetical protein REPUB_Repub13aG0061100 [Reevesia pubescens]
MAMKNENWPADMMTEILLKLPVKSIIRFKCVSKTWFHLFSNPSFVSQHLSISKKNNKRLIVYYPVENHENFAMRIFVDQNLVSHLDLRQQLPAHFPDLYYFDMCVDNGLVCLCDRDESRITLWNPAAREFKILPQCNQNIPPKVNTYGHLLGFGLDPLSNDYKVIYVRDYVDLEQGMSGPPHYAVYKMSTDSWRVCKEEEVKFFEHLCICPNKNNACVNGVYYWQVFNILPLGLIDRKVLAFNLGTEVFRLIEYPSFDSCGRLLPLHDDRISIWDTELLTHRKPSNQVWVLNDERHWTKLFKIEPVLQVQSMFGFWKNDKVLVEPVSAELVLYDLETEEFRELGIKTIEGEFYFQVYAYEESLVAIRRE